MLKQEKDAHMGTAFLRPVRSEAIISWAYVWAGFFLCSFGPPHAARGDDWPQWRGPYRTGVSAEKGLLSEWPAGGPKPLWSVADQGVGYSGPAVVGETLYVMGTRGDTESLLALDVHSGKERWAVPIGPLFTFPGNSWGDGPRGTPTVVDNRVYALGAQGILLAADARTGQVAWRANLPKDLGGIITSVGGGHEKIGWGYCESP